MPFNLKLKYQDHLLWLMTSDIEQQHHHHLFNILYLFMISKFFPPFFRNISIHPEFPWLPACHAAAVPLRLPWPSTKPRPSAVPWTCRQGCSVGAARRGQAIACKPKGPVMVGWIFLKGNNQIHMWVGWMLLTLKLSHGIGRLEDVLFVFLENMTNECGKKITAHV